MALNEDAGYGGQTDEYEAGAHGSCIEDERSEGGEL